MSSALESVRTEAEAGALGRLTRTEACLEREFERLSARYRAARQSLEGALEDKARLAGLLDSVLENLTAGVVLLDGENRVLAANRAARELGAVREDPRGEQRPHPLIAGGTSEEPLRPEGPDGPAWDLRQGTLDLPGRGACRLLLIQDVTSLVRLEQQARRRSSLEALGRMAAELAHEVRNPLGSLELCATMLIEDLAGQPATRELAEQVLLGVRRLSGTVNRLLGSVRQRPHRRERVELDRLIEEVVSFTRPLALSRGVEIRTPPPGRRVAELDAEGVRRALLNLLGNALEATPRGGVVRVLAETAGPLLRLGVCDSGPGIPAEERGRVLEAFYTTRADGNGLGLALAERVAEAHGGRLEIADAPEGGASVSLLLVPDTDRAGGGEQEK